MAVMTCPECDAEFNSCSGGMSALYAHLKAEHHMGHSKAFDYAGLAFERAEPRESQEAFLNRLYKDCGK